MFPGYLFCRFGPEVWGPIVTTPGVIRILGAGNRPTPIEDAEIERIHRIADAEIDVEPCRFLQVGHRIRVTDGPLTGVEGALSSVRGRDRLVVSVELLRRSIAVELPMNWVSVYPD
jgi:transcription antitermination factor NusG